MKRLLNLNFFSNMNVFFFFLFLTILIYGRSLFFDFFIFDDYNHIHENPNFGDDFSKIFDHFTRPFAPLTYFVWGILAWFFGKENPLPFHTLNIIFHSLNSFFVFMWIKKVFQVFKLFEKKAVLAAFVGAVVFLIHPQKVEAVVWISSFKDLLGFNLGILAFIFFLHSKANLSSFILSLAMVCLAALAKPNMIILIVPFFILDVLRNGINEKKFFMYGGLFLLSICFLFLYYQKAMISHLAVMPHFFGVVSMATISLIFYLSKFLIPFEFSFDYGFSFPNLIPDIKLMSLMLVAFFLLCFLVFSFIRWRGEKGLFSLSAALYLILLFPVLGFMPFIFQNISTVADRYAYLPSLACSLFVSGIWYFFVFKNWMRKGIAFLCLTVLAVIGVLQTDKWRDSKSILTHSLKVNKKSYASAMALGEIAETEKKWTEAFFYYKKANGINPVDFNAWLKIIFYHKKFGTGDDVLASLYQERIDSGYKSSPLIFKLLINYYLDSKKNDAALKYFELFRRFFPESEYVGELQTSMPKNKNEP